MMFFLANVNIKASLKKKKKYLLTLSRDSKELLMLAPLDLQQEWLLLLHLLTNLQHMLALVNQPMGKLLLRLVF